MYTFFSYEKNQGWTLSGRKMQFSVTRTLYAVGFHLKNPKITFENQFLLENCFKNAKKYERQLRAQFAIQLPYMVCDVFLVDILTTPTFWLGSFQQENSRRT